MKRIVSLLLAALTLSAAGCSKAPEALDMPSKTQSQVEQALPENGKRLDEIALPEAQTRQDQPVVTDQAEPEPDQTGAAAAEQAEPPAEDPITMEGKDMQITFDRLPDTLEEFSALCNDLTKPENTCALFLLALNTRPYVEHGLRTNYRDEITRMVEEQLFTFFLQVAERHGLYAQCSHWELKLVMRYHSQAVLGILRSWSEADSDDLDHIVHVVHQLIVGEISPRQ